MICGPITLVSNEENLSLVAPIFNEMQLIELIDSAFPACLGPGVPRFDETPIVGLNQTPSHSRYTDNHAVVVLNGFQEKLVRPFRKARTGLKFRNFSGINRAGGSGEGTNHCLAQLP